MNTVAFDVVGTLFSLERARRALQDLGAPPLALDLWFAMALRDAFALSHAGGYRPLGEVLAATLPRALVHVDVDAGAEGQERAIAGLAELSPVEGAEEACTLLSEAGWRILALTNASRDFTHELLHAAGLARFFDELLSCDGIRKTKPHPDVYAMARERAIGELWLIAGHAWDIGGASMAGLRTAWISDGYRDVFPSIFPAPDVIAPDLRTAATLVLRASGEHAGEPA